MIDKEHKTIKEKDKENKVIKFYKNYINAQEQELDWMYKQDEEYYRDEIEQKELLIKGFRIILNLIEKQSKVIDEMADKLSEYTCWNKDNLDMNKLAPIEEIKQYFYRKAENENG